MQNLDAKAVSKKKNMKQKITEDMLQAQCVEWFRLQYPGIKIIHIPNGGSRNIVEAVKLKKMGVEPGVPDLFIPFILPNGNFYKIGLWIEMKVNKNKCTLSQKEMQSYLKQQGYIVKTCYTFDEFVGVVKEYFCN